MRSRCVKQSNSHPSVHKALILKQSSYMAMLHRICASQNSINVWLRVTTRDYAWLHVTMRDNAWLRVTMRDYVWQCVTTRDNVWLRVTMCDYAWIVIQVILNCMVEITCLNFRLCFLWINPRCMFDSFKRNSSRIPIPAVYVSWPSILMNLLIALRFVPMYWFNAMDMVFPKVWHECPLDFNQTQITKIHLSLGL